MKLCIFYFVRMTYANMKKMSSCMLQEEDSYTFLGLWPSENSIVNERKHLRTSQKVLEKYKKRLRFIINHIYCINV